MFVVVVYVREKSAVQLFFLMSIYVLFYEHLTKYICVRPLKGRV